MLNGIFSISSKEEFKQKALAVYAHQYLHNPVYHKYNQLLGKSPEKVHELEDIPFLPIQFYKSQKVHCGNDYQKIFTSSGTSQKTPSRHYVHDLGVYEKSFTQGFQGRFGRINYWSILALLPSYLEREGSSLVYMVDCLIKQADASSGFYLYNQQELLDQIKTNESEGKKTLLFGVSFALLDFADFFQKQGFDLKNTTILDTGGMKGRKEEMTKKDFNAYLKHRFKVTEIQSEYGMTELLSQAYTLKENQFKPPAWMKVLCREINDPFSYTPMGQRGGINIIDLANYHSCSFIATDDLGLKINEDLFQILGRFDHSDLRGCNLLLD